MNDIQLSDAMAVLVDNIVKDESYSWSWWCNLVMSAIDAGASREVAEGAAEHFLSNLSHGRVRMDKDPFLAKDRIDRYGQLLLEINEDDASVDDIKATIEIIKKRNGLGDIRQLLNDHRLIPPNFNEHHWAWKRFGGDLSGLFEILNAATNVLFPIQAAEQSDVSSPG